MSSTDYRGNSTTFVYNADGWLTQEVQPVTATSAITTLFGYDAAGNRTEYTDGNGGQWWTTYNSWNLPSGPFKDATVLLKLICRQCVCRVLRRFHILSL